MTRAPLEDSIISVTPQRAALADEGRLPQGTVLNGPVGSLSVLVFAKTPEELSFRSLDLPGVAESRGTALKEDAVLTLAYDRIARTLSIKTKQAGGEGAVMVRGVWSKGAKLLVPFRSEGTLDVYLIDYSDLGKGYSQKALDAKILSIRFDQVTISSFHPGPGGASEGPGRTCTFGRVIFHANGIRPGGGR